MYDGLSDKSVIKEDSKVVNIIDTEKSVKAVLADGSVEEGDLLLGVDGVHSKVRSWMWNHANAAHPGMITVQEKKSEETPPLSPWFNEATS